MEAPPPPRGDALMLRAGVLLLPLPKLALRLETPLLLLLFPLRGEAVVLFLFPPLGVAVVLMRLPALPLRFMLLFCVGLEAGAACCGREPFPLRVFTLVERALVLLAAPPEW